MAAEGHRVVIVDIDGKGAYRVAQMVHDEGGTALAVKADISDKTQIADGQVSGRTYVI